MTKVAPAYRESIGERIAEAFGYVFALGLFGAVLLAAFIGLGAGKAWLVGDRRMLDASLTWLAVGIGIVQAAWSTLNAIVPSWLAWGALIGWCAYALFTGIKRELGRSREAVRSAIGYEAEERRRDVARLEHEISQLKAELHKQKSHD